MLPTITEEGSELSDAKNKELPPRSSVGGIVSASAAASQNDPQPYAYRNEVWRSYAYGDELRNYVYQTFTYLNGYTSTDHNMGRIELTPLQYEFYEGAWLHKISYNFH